MSYLPYNLEDIPDHRVSYQLSLPPVRAMPARMIYALYWKMDDHTGKTVYRVVSAGRGTQFGFVYWYAEKEPSLKLARLVIRAVHGKRGDELLKDFMEAGGYSIVPIRPDSKIKKAFLPDWDYLDEEDHDDVWPWGTHHDS